MIAIDKLKQENQYILELKSVLSELIDNKELLTNPVFCDLLDRFGSSVQVHLDHEDRTVYSELLNHGDKKVNEVASQFLSNTHELKRVFKGYVKRWCGNNNIADHEAFKSETKEIFRLIDRRIEIENNKLFPIVSNL